MGQIWVINLLSVGVLLFVVSLFKFAGTGDAISGVIVLSIVLVSPVLYGAAVVAAVNWGTTIKAAFDLYRHDLRALLHLNLPEPSLKGEREMWRGISLFFARNDTRLFTGFDYDVPLQLPPDNNGKHVPSPQQEVNDEEVE